VKLVRAGALTTAAPYAYAAVANGFVFTAGACPLDADGNVAARDDIDAQARLCMQNLVVALEAAGSTLTQVVKTTVFVASSERADLVTAWNVHAEYFGQHDVPSTLLGVSMLGYEGQLVEIEAIAIADSEVTKD
jgi:enamine deaminase RidA (YjgF/YER057c/UK114 family)